MIPALPCTTATLAREGKIYYITREGGEKSIYSLLIYLLNCLLAKTFFSLGVEGQLLTKKCSAITLAYVFFICNVLKEFNFFFFLYCTKSPKKSGKQKKKN